MALPTTRAEFAEHCLRRLGKPVIEINVDPDQVDDRIDEALLFWWDYHYDGSEKTYVKHQITQTDIDNRYIPISDSVFGVTNIFDIGDSIATNNLFNIRYQFALNEVYDMSRYDLTNYYIAFSHLALLEEMLVGKQPIRFNRHRNRLYIDMDWEKVTVGQYIIAEAYTIIDPSEHPDVWKDRLLIEYATAKIKYQWGSNLTKFNNMQLPGGLTFNGEQILADAREEIQRLEEQMKGPLHEPIGFFIG